MEKFAGYGFNRSHSAAYGLLTYQTAYLKRYFPVEFFAALLTCDKDDTDAVVKFIAEAKANGIAVLRPDVNESDTDFSVVKVWADDEKQPRENRKRAKKVIRFGLGAVKGVGEGAVEVVKVARDQGGAFLTLFDFCKRVDGRKVNRKVIEALVKAGAFDGVAAENGITRSRMFGAIDVASERAAEAQRERESGQTNLLALFAGPERQHRPGPARRGQVPRRRGVDAEGAARVREGVARLLHQRPSARSLRQRDPPLHHARPAPTAWRRASATR